MGDYNFAGLNPREFEHLVQALALETIAPGVIPFGDGPDGGREATYQGKMKYPSDAESWTGYLVIQCKYCIRPTHDTKKDGSWLLEQLRSEMNKWVNMKKSVQKPDYYLFVTNISLTSVQDVGSKDKAFSILENAGSTIGIKGYDIWDFDKLCRMLDVHETIRHKYFAFISSGDVLAEMMRYMRGQQVDFDSVMSLFLQKELGADQFVKLEQAGHATEHKTALAQVFVDVPVFDQPHSDPIGQYRRKDRPDPNIMKELLESGSQMLRPSVLKKEDMIIQSKHIPDPGRYVIVGGPGQGKSTIGQFLCQLHRAAMLMGRPQHTLAPESQAILNSFVRQCFADNLELPLVRRFPIRVVLDQFATDLATNKIKSLLGYILDKINSRTERECTIDEIRHWLSAYPWLIVLDGLDEVPVTSNRKQVLEKIAEFWVEAALQDADVQVVATTRPQGYSEDFSSRFYQHRYLVSLSKEQALHYANRLVDARYGNDPDRKNRILRRLETACNQEVTLRLMRTPLQITIMATLVDQIGQPPQERWRLFRDYYEVIYRRETEREIPASRILQQRKTDVNAIHYRVGLLLQTESERAGSTESKLPIDRFNTVVLNRIQEEGYVGDVLESRTKEITDAALNRLVFLVGLESDRIGFEIRQFQEFMAAEAIMDERDDLVRERLKTIAPIVHWRSVFLFAAGKCFAERQYLRDMLITLCEQLNHEESDKLSGVILAGSRLALDILEEGVAREQPNYARSLVHLALQLLDLPDVEANAKLAFVYDASMERAYKDALVRRLELPRFGQRIGAWAVLKLLIDKGEMWAETLANEKWPNDISEQQEILRLSDNFPIGTWSLTKMIEVVPTEDSNLLWSMRWLR